MVAKTTFYSESEEGTTIFRTERRIGDVRIPNYVYDIWQPIIGAVGMGVYGTYCRLERSGAVKGMSQGKLAKICRIGTRRLATINEQLEECGFITIKQPESYQKLMHHTTEITVYDPPQEVSKEIKDKYAPDSGYEILTPWLHDDDAPALSNGNAGDAKQKCGALSNDNANVASLGLQPLEVESPTPNGAGQKGESDGPRSGDQQVTHHYGESGVRPGNAGAESRATGPVNRQAHSKSGNVTGNTRQDDEDTRKRISRALRGTLTRGEDDPIPKSSLAQYIEQQIQGQHIPSGQLNKLAMTYTEQLPGGKQRKHPSPDELWETHPLYPQFVQERLKYYKDLNISQAQKRSRLINALSNYKANEYSWLNWKPGGASGQDHYPTDEDYEASANC